LNTGKRIQEARSEGGMINAQKDSGTSDSLPS
jgi:hypothetical protein